MTPINSVFKEITVNKRVNAMPANVYTYAGIQKIKSWFFIVIGKALKIYYNFLLPSRTLYRKFSLTLPSPHVARDIHPLHQRTLGLLGQENKDIGRVKV